ncbi:hypothetical protein GCM10018793_09670 [Streptomyces sulfonofaciens]|uniref:DUF2891 domain-containing protein n=1 Tax=Streptomyces sulfonofaciens TaxID=68272 RepID=A0A919FU57_9ACTN|nr:DUF2891 domain-containing protein [Streptomyces sulfonofaciens]GHH72512.1 hypothetical protein GCM10018793_09670 [Streptomyces sulfonofaciens]
MSLAQDPARRPTTLDEHADAFARLAAANVTRAYPYAPQQLLTGPDDLTPPRTRHPAFYGSYDWHSSVHMHWLLVRLLRRTPAGIDTQAVREVLDAHLTAGALAAEAAHLRANPTFERPYGWAWLAMLAAECTGASADGVEGAQAWAKALGPAADVVAELAGAWLAKATYPIRHGVHTNSAFALGLLLDSGTATEAATDAVRRWFLADRDYPAAWEPSGQDFLSPALTEADAVRRILPEAEFAEWLTGFLPGLAEGRPAGLLTPPVVSDPADPQIGHLLGLGLSRAAALSSIGRALPAGDPRVAVLSAAAADQLTAALPFVATGTWASDHWLATFATLALESAGADGAGA